MRASPHVFIRSGGPAVINRSGYKKDAIKYRIY